MEPELDPPQPAPVARAVGEALADGEQGPDPWWSAGIEESLGS